MTADAPTDRRGGPVGLLFVVSGALLLAVPEPLTSFVGALLLLVGVAGWLGSRLR